jgi:hypothetical protein
MVRLIASTAAAPKGARLQRGDLMLQQLMREQNFAEPRLQPLALQRLAIGGSGRKGSCTGSEEHLTPLGKCGRGDAERSRHPLQVLAPQQPQRRVIFALARVSTNSYPGRCRQVDHHALNT